LYIYIGRVFTSRFRKDSHALAMWHLATNWKW